MLKQLHNIYILGPLLVQSKETNTCFLIIYLPSRIFASTSVESAVISSLIKDSNVRGTCWNSIVVTATSVASANRFLTDRITTSPSVREPLFQP